jgi:hypothetical protein
MKIEITEGVETPITKFFSATPETKSHVCALSLDMTGNCMICAIERERDEARADADRNADILSGLELRSTDELARLERERDEAREQVKELIYIAERAIDLAEIDFENDKFGVVSELRDGVERIKEGAK